MKSFGLHHFFVLFSYFVLIAVMATSYHFFPLPLATHFDLHGRPNGWMTRNENVGFLAVIGLVVPPLVIGGFYLRLRKGEVRINRGFGKSYQVPAKHLDPVRRCLIRQGFWFSGLTLLFLAGVQVCILFSNRTQHPHLNGDGFGALVFVFVLITFLITYRATAYLKSLLQS